MLELLRKLNVRAGLTALLLAVPLAGTAQEVRDVVSNRLAIGGDEAALLLEFADGGDLEVALTGGEVRIDGRTVGSYTPGEGVDSAWRALLGEVATLSNGALAEALRDWMPPEELSGDDRELARAIDRALEEALRSAETEAVTEVRSSNALQERGGTVDVGRLLRSMLRSEIVPALAEALEDIEYEGLTVYVDEDVTVTERVDGPVLVVDGNVIVAAEIDGDVVVVRGSLTLDPGAHILGDVKLVDGRMYRDGGTVMGDVEELDDMRMRDDLRAELRAELRNELRRELRGERRSSGMFSPFAGVVDGITSLFGDLITFMILSAVGLGVVLIAKENLEVVADTARRSPGRAAMVGLAGGFLVLPAWVLGILALVVSVVGLIALPFWLVLFPLAVALAAGLGYYAMARNIGEWVAEQRFNGLHWLRASNTAYAVVAGVGALISFSVVGHLVGIVPGLGLFEGLFTSIGAVATFVATTVGFGAVLLTRGGKQPDYYGAVDPFDADLWSSDPAPSGATRDFRDEPATDSGPAADTAEVTNEEDGNDA